MDDVFRAVLVKHLACAPLGLQAGGGSTDRTLMNDGDCLVCPAAREAGRAECKACGQVFQPETIDPGDPAYYFGAPPVPSTAVAPRAKQTKRWLRLLRRGAAS
jgi:hypothetical protein